VTGSLVAEFSNLDAMVKTARQVRLSGYCVIDALTPFPVPEVSDVLGERPSRIRVAMFVAGFATAAAGFGLQWYSAVVSYPFNVGGRPLDSWAVFLLVPFEVGMLAAALAGFAAFLAGGGLPRLHHPVFDVAGIERATQDHFFLVATTTADTDLPELRRLLENAGAIAVTGVVP